MCYPRVVKMNKTGKLLTKTGMLTLVLASLAWLISNRNPEDKVLGQLVSPLPSSGPIITITTSPTPSPSPSPSPSPTPIPTPTPVPQPEFTHEQINQMIDQIGRIYSVDPNVLRHLAICESTFNPNAVNGPYAGLYQFDTRSWESFRKLINQDPDPGLRFNIQQSIHTAAFAISINRTAIWPNCYP